MNIFEKTSRKIKNNYGPALPPALLRLLEKANTRIQDALFGGVYRSLNGTVEIKLSARLRTWPEEYEPLAFQVIGRTLRPGFLAVDVGANIGLYTLAMAKMVQPQGKVVSFEPASESYAALVAHVRQNRLTKIVEAHMLAVGDEPGVCSFVEESVLGTNRIGSRSSQHTNNARSVPRRMTTLDEVFDGARSLPDLIKIDVEGFEMSVLRGAQRTLSRKPCPILCEVHPGYWKTMNLAAQDFAKLIGDLQYQAFELTGEPCIDIGKASMVLLKESTR
jgi:FkbM family methyltransferase